MKQSLKNITILILGIIIGMIINIGLIVFGGFVFSPSETFDPMNAINWDFRYFIFPFLAHSIGTLSGAFITSKLTRNNHMIIPFIVGLYFLSGGIYMATILPAPIWFISLDLILCYIPMAFFGWKISNY